MPLGSCYVPGCRSGNIGAPVQLFQLAFTASEEIRQKWLANIPPRTDRGFDFDKDGLCVEHFKEEYVIKTGLGTNAPEGGAAPEEAVPTAEPGNDDLLQIQLLTNDAVPTIFIPIQAKKVSIFIPTIKIKKPEPPQLPKEISGEKGGESPTSVSSLAVEVEAERNDDLDDDGSTGRKSPSMDNGEEPDATPERHESRKRKAKERSFVAKKKTTMMPTPRESTDDIAISDVHSMSPTAPVTLDPRRCIAPYCNATGYTNGILLHDTPYDEHLQEEWMKSLEDAYAKVGLVFSAVVPTGERNVVCSRHFYKEDYHTSGRGKYYRRTLMETSIPTVYEDSSLSPFIDESDPNGIPTKKVTLLSRLKANASTSFSSNGHSFQNENGGDNLCFVKKCPSLTTDSKHYCPEDSNMVTQWIRNLPKREFPFDYTKHPVCIRHFHESFIVDTSNLISEVDDYDSSRPNIGLTSDAVPTIFEGYPTYCQKKLPKKRSIPEDRIIRNHDDSSTKSPVLTPLYVSSPVSPSPQRRTRGRPRKSTSDPNKKGPEMVDGFEIEYTYDEEYFQPVWDNANSGSGDTPLLQVNSVRSYAPAKIQLASKRLKEANQGIEFILPDESLSSEQLLDISHINFNLDYIFSLKPRIRLPEGDNLWNFHLFFDYDANRRVLSVCEVVVRNGRMIFRRVIKVFEDLTFRIECNGSELTQMFTETGNKIDSIPRLQEMISDLAAFTPCEGWSEYPFLDNIATGRKVEGIWFSTECEGLCLTSNRCAACTHFKQSLALRKNRNHVPPEKLAKELTASQLHLLPKNDPLRLNIQINELKTKHDKCRKDVVRLEKREQTLMNDIRKMKEKEKKAAAAAAAAIAAAAASSRKHSSKPSSSQNAFAKKKTGTGPPPRPGPASSKPGPASKTSRPGPASSKPSTSRGHSSGKPQLTRKLVRAPIPPRKPGEPIPIIELSDED